MKYQKKCVPCFVTNFCVVAATQFINVNPNFIVRFVPLHAQEKVSSQP